MSRRPPPPAPLGTTVGVWITPGGRRRRSGKVLFPVKSNKEDKPGSDLGQGQSEGQGQDKCHEGPGSSKGHEGQDTGSGGSRDSSKNVDLCKPTRNSSPDLFSPSPKLSSSPRLFHSSPRFSSSSPKSSSQERKRKQLTLTQMVKPPPEVLVDLCTLPNWRGGRRPSPQKKEVKECSSGSSTDFEEEPEETETKENLSDYVFDLGNLLSTTQDGEEVTEVKIRKDKSPEKRKKTPDRVEENESYFNPAPVESASTLTSTFKRDKSPVKYSFNSPPKASTSKKKVDKPVVKPKKTYPPMNIPRRPEYRDIANLTADILADFDKLPEKKMDGFDNPMNYKTVRNKAERAKMSGWDCDLCRNYYKDLEDQMHPSEVQRLKDNCSRHRSYRPINQQCTPPDLWKTVMPSTEEAFANGDMAWGVASPSRPPKRYDLLEDDL